MKNKVSIKERMRYWFDRFMSRGLWPLVGLLTVFCTGVVVLASWISVKYSAGAGSFSSMLWRSFIHLLSHELLAEDETDNTVFIVMMLIVTFTGIFVASMIIGIITSMLSTKLRDLRKGHSPIIEKGHTVILGFNENTYELIGQLVEANRNCRHGCIVIVDSMSIDTMEEGIKAHIQDRGSTEIIIRSVPSVNDSTLKMVHLENAKSVIINSDDDFIEIKMLLAVSSYLSENGIDGRLPNVIADIRDKAHLRAAQIAGQDRAHIVYIKEMLARIIAHTTRHSGFSDVFTDFFDFEGNEFYSESFPELAGKQFRDILCLFEKSAVIGLERKLADGKIQVMMNPPMDTVVGKDDLVIHFAEDDRTSYPDLRRIYDAEYDKAIVTDGKPEAEKLRVLVLGENEMLPDIVSELDHYVGAGSAVSMTCAEDSAYLDKIRNMKLAHISVSNEQCNIYDHETVARLLEGSFTNVLLLSDLSSDPDTADNKTLLLLLYLRELSDIKGSSFRITSEIRSSETQRRARTINVNDFIVGTNITNLIMTQYSEDPSRELLFNDILDADGSEIYMKPSRCYIRSGQKVNFYTVTKSASGRNEIPIGYKLAGRGGKSSIVLNPPKSNTIVFSDEDMLILVAED